MQKAAAKKKNWVRMCALGDIPRLGVEKFVHEDHEIAIVRSFKDEYFAVNNLCPHKQGPLSEGMVHGDKLSCPLHDWTFDLKTGKALEPDEGQLSCYEVQVIEDSIWVSF